MCNRSFYSHLVYFKESRKCVDLLDVKNIYLPMRLSNARESPFDGGKLIYTNLNFCQKD